MLSLKKSLAMLAVSAACIMPAYVADAATIAFLPVINNSEMLLDEANGVFFDRAIEAIKKNGEYELVDTEQAEKAINKYSKEGILPDYDTLANIANEAGVDAVVAYRIDELKEEQEQWFGEWSYKVHLHGQVAAYNALSKKTDMSHKVSEDVDRPYSESARFNIPREVFADSVTREINRVIGNKKLNIAKPRISGHGQKGDR